MRIPSRCSCRLTFRNHLPHPEERPKAASRRMGDVGGGAYFYMLRCSDGSYYVGTARNGLEACIAEHNAGTFGGYTAKRRPVTLIFSQHFESISDAIAAERQVKGWTRSKK